MAQYSQVTDLKRLPIRAIHLRARPDESHQRTCLPSKKLVDAIRIRGEVHPVVVHPHPRRPDEYELLVGEEYWAAARQAELATISARVCHDPQLPSALAALDALTADRRRNPITVAETLQRLCSIIPHAERVGRSIPHQALAELSGLSRGLVTQHLSLLGLPSPVRKLLAQGRLSLGHGKALCATELADNQERTIQVAEQAMRGDWSVRKLEDEIRAVPTTQPGAMPRRTSVSYPGERVTDPNITHLADRLSQKLGCPAEIEHETSGAGVIHLRYFSLEILDGLLQSLGLQGEE